jgi:amylosucrase
VRGELPYLRELGITYLHLMPLLRSRPGPERRGLRRDGLRRRGARLGAPWTTCARSRRTCARTGWRCASTSSSTTPRASTRGRSRDGGRPGRLAFYRTFPDRTEPDRYEATLPEVFPTPRPATSPGSRARALGVDDVQRLPVGPGLHEPRGLRRDGRGHARPGRRRASTSCGSTRCRSCGSAWGRTARTSPRSTSCCRRFRSVLRIAAPAVAFKAEAIVSPHDLVAYLGQGRTRARSATWPTTTRSWSCCGARWPPAACHLLTQTLRPCRRPARARAG